MKVIGINGSARKDGNTALIISKVFDELNKDCLLYTSPSPRDPKTSRMPSSA